MFSILYVDDEPGLLEIGKLFLEQGGQFSVDTVASAAEALEVLRTRRYDAIISDYQMPVMDGIEFLKRVRAEDKTVPFIIFTGRGREEVVIQAFNEGADFYLQKGGEPISQFAELGHKTRKAILQRRAEASIRDHERREADIIDFLPDATFAIDTGGRVITWNRAIEKMTGVSAENILGKGDYEYALPFYHERRPILIDLVLSENHDASARYPYIKKEGKNLFSEITIPHFNEGRGAVLWFTASPLYDTAGTVIGAIESIREVTESKRAEEALNQSEEFLNSVVENIPDMIFVKDGKDLRFIRFNKAGEDLLGYTRQELYGKNEYDFFPGDEAEIFIKNDRLVLDTKQAADFPEEKIQTRYLGQRILHTKKIPILDENGKALYLLGISEDITERRRAEGELRNSVGFLNSLIDQSPTPMWISDETGTLIRINPACCELLKVTKEEVVGKYSLFEDNIVKEQGFLPRVRNVFEKGQVTQFQLVYDTNQLKTIPLEKRVSLFLDVTIFPVRDIQGKITNAVVQHADITRRQEAESALLESGQKYRTVFETTGTATVLIENDETISLANSEFARLSGYPKDEIENRKKWTEFVVPEDLERMRAQHRLRREGRESPLTHYEFRFRTRTGNIRDIHLSIDLIPGTNRSVASLLDITERKKAEDRLIAANEEYENLLDQIQDIYYRSDTEGRLVKASRSWATLLGYDTVSECIGRSIADDFYLNPADRGVFLEAIARDGRVTDYQVLLRKKDGTPVLVSTSSHAITDKKGIFLGIEGTFRDVTEQRDREHIFRTQLDLGLALQNVHDMNETLDLCLDAAIRISGLDAGGIYLVDQGTGVLTLILSRNLGTDFIRSVSRYSADSANGKIVLAGKPVYARYSDTGLVHTAVQKQEGLRASAIIPVAFNNRIIACLNIASHTFDDIPANARIALETVALQIGAAVERIRAEEALLKSEQRYRNIIEDQTEFICRFLPDGTHVFVNDAYCRYFGLAREQILGHRFRPDMPPEDREAMKRFFATLTPDHPIDIIVHRIIMPDGRIRWQRWSDRAIFDPAGTLIEYQSVGRDITMMKETEQALLESEARYRSLSEASGDLIFVIDKDDRVVYANNSAATAFGLPVHEIIGRERNSLFPPEVSAGQLKAIGQVFATGEGFRSSGRLDFGGQAHWFDHSLMPIRDAAGSIIQVLGISRDITEQKNIEDALRVKSDDLDSRNRLISTLLDTIPIGIFMVEAPSGKPIIANREAARLLGRGILPDVTEENLVGIYKAYRVPGFRPYPAQEMPVIRGMYGESLHIDDMVVVRPDGTKVQLEVFGTPVVDNRGTVIASLVSILDITDRKRAEQVIREANRKINLLTSITRHDVANQVTVLRGYSKLAQMKKPGHAVADLLQKIDTAVSTISDQIAFTKAYQELGVHAPGWQSIRDIIARQKPDRISLSCTCDAEIFADPMLERVFFNIIDNAVRHGEKVTEIAVSCCTDCDHLTITVADNGVGVPPDLKEKIFEKGFGKHTGFGLFLAREILAITGIAVRETGTPGKGARFEISVPEGMYRLSA
jgi:PAS domain S-box-containing protein